MNNVLVNRHLSRRNFIKGLAGAGLLSATQVEKAFAQTRAPMRVCFIALQHGWGTGLKGIDNITGTEYDFKLPAFWSPFESIKDRCVFVDGLRGTFWGNAHDESYSDILTAGIPVFAPPDPSVGTHFPKPVNPSIDYLLEKHYQMPALRLSAGYRSWGVAHHPLSFNDRLESLAFHRNAYTAYESIFLTPSNQADPVTADLFSYLSGEADNILKNIDLVDERNKLFSYLESINSMHSKLNKPSAPAGTATLAQVPLRQQNLGAEIDSMLDMVRVSFTNDTHRVAVVGIGEATNEFPWTDSKGKNYIGITGFTGQFHHEVAHYGSKVDAPYAYAAWVRYNIEKVVKFINGLKNTLDIDGKSLLDNTIVVLTGEVGNGNHDNTRKPHIVIGGNSVIRGNRWYQVPLVESNSAGGLNMDGAFVSVRSLYNSRDLVSGRTHADLYTRIAQITGLNLQKMGIDILNNGPLDI